jgi:hypothetical protein
MQQLSLLEVDHEFSFTFPIAIHGFISRDLGTRQTQYRNISSFGRALILCGILEAIEVSKMVQINYSSIEGWLNGKTSSFILAGHFLQVLNFWGDFYWDSCGKYYEISGGLGQPQLEVAHLHMYGKSKLTDMEGSDSQSIRDMAIDSTDCLCWASQIGFLEV